MIETQTQKITFADIFSGCGGLTNGFYQNSHFKGLLAVDWWPIARKVFLENHPRMPFELHDLYDPNEVDGVIQKLKGKCDILLGGPPCQGFSTLGSRREKDRAREHARCSLVETFLHICLGVEPKIIVMENVRGITSKKHSTGRTFPQVINEILNNGNGDAAYDVCALQINTLEYGLAQTRIRWFLFAVRKDRDLNGRTLNGILERIERQKTNMKRTLRDVIGDLPHVESGEGDDVINISVDGVQKIIYNHRAMKHSSKLVRKLSYVSVGGGLPDVPRDLLTDHLRKMVDGFYGEGGHVKNIYGRLDWEKPCGTIVAGIDKITCGRFVHPSSNRLLTPRECARIQSFPDSFRFLGSLVNQYYLIGNAVPPEISRVIANAIFETLMLKDQNTKMASLNIIMSEKYP